MGVNPGFILVNNKDTPKIAEEYMHGFDVMRSLKCDIPLGSHPAMFRLQEKYPKLGQGPNPYIDHTGYLAYIDLKEKQFNAELQRQKDGGKP